VQNLPYGTGGKIKARTVVKTDKKAPKNNVFLALPPTKVKFHMPKKKKLQHLTKRSEQRWRKHGDFRPGSPKVVSVGEESG